MAPAPNPRFPPAAALFVGVLATSASAILVRFAQEEAPSLAIAAGRMTIATAILLPLTLARRRGELRALDPAGWRLAIVAGAMLGLHFATWITSLAYTSVANSVVLVTTTPLWVAIASPLLLREPLARTLKIGIPLALLGSILVAASDLLPGAAGVAADRSTSAAANRPLLGNALALAGAWTAAGYFLIGRRLRPRLSLLSYTTLVYGTAALFLLASLLLTRTDLLGYRPVIYGLFALMAIFPQLIGHSSYNWALGYLPAAYVAVAVISEPIGAAILALAIFGELPGPLALVGAAFILAGIILAGRRG
jgi:drug/metabolite transporter (DMT)-like permease